MTVDVKSMPVSNSCSLDSSLRWTVLLSCEPSFLRVFFREVYHKVRTVIKIGINTYLETRTRNFAMINQNTCLLEELNFVSENSLVGKLVQKDKDW